MPAGGNDLSRRMKELALKRFRARHIGELTDIGHVGPWIRIPLSAILWLFAIAKLGGIAGFERPSAAFKAPFTP